MKIVFKPTSMFPWARDPIMAGRFSSTSVRLSTLSISLYSHLTDGGFLQFGSNNTEDPSALLHETDVKCIFISPGYRLGLLGFLASRELCTGPSSSGNFGFWDLRLALEWTYDNIEYFGGDRENITVGGLSAGAYATFHQLAYDVGPNVERQIIRRVVMWSNGCGVQPKGVPEAQQQFDDLVHALGIPQTWRGEQKLDALRAKSANDLIEAAGSIRQKFFRPVTDGEFLSETLFQDIYTGKFGKRLNDLGIQILIGDLTQEFHLYKNAFPPKSYDQLVDRLSWDYPRHIAVDICKPFKPRESCPKRTEEQWKDIFGRIYADMQIHSTMRGYLQCIYPSIPLSHVHRYRIDWRTASVDKRLPKALGATHGTDLSIWLFGNGDSLTIPEKSTIREFLKPVAAFLNGEQVHWGTSSLDEVRCITAEGKVEIKKDDAWGKKLPLWHLTKEATRFPSGRSNL